MPIAIIVVLALAATLATPCLLLTDFLCIDSFHPLLRSHARNERQSLY